jgi:hypothetical protein
MLVGKSGALNMGWEGGSGDIDAGATVRGATGVESVPQTGARSEIVSITGAGSGAFSMTGAGSGACCPGPVGAPGGRGRGDESRAGNRRKKPKIEMMYSPNPNPSTIRRMEKTSRLRFIATSRRRCTSLY